VVCVSSGDGELAYLHSQLSTTLTTLDNYQVRALPTSHLHLHLPDHSAARIRHGFLVPHGSDACVCAGVGGVDGPAVHVPLG
jgi:hypothetical protein